MKITYTPEGAVEIDVAEGETQTALAIIQALQGEVTKVAEEEAIEEEPVPFDPAVILTPIQRETYDAMAEYPGGVHYNVLAEKTGLDPNVANSRCNALRNLGYAERIRGGVYRLLV